MSERSRRKIKAGQNSRKIGHIFMADFLYAYLLTFSTFYNNILLFFDTFVTIKLQRI
jgi:hypothetical protein